MTEFVVSEHTIKPIALRGLRGAVAQRMHASLRDMAQYTVFSEADVTELVAAGEKTSGRARLSYDDFVLGAVAQALQRHPRLNAYIVDDLIYMQPEVNLGIAIALDEGIMVGVVRDATQRSLSEIASERRRLVTAVREGDRSPATVLGSTFTISNLGPYGVDGFTPVVNPPEVAILGVGAIRETAARADEGIEWRSRLALSLTVDHRAVDEVPAAKFLADVVAFLSQPQQLLVRSGTPVNPGSVNPESAERPTGPGGACV